MRNCFFSPDWALPHQSSAASLSAWSTINTFCFWSNHLGQVAGGFFEFIGTQSNIYAELQAICTGLSLCIQLNLARVWIETDSKVAILLISQQGGHWSYQHILTKIRNLLKMIEYRISHIFREGNAVADRLANLAVEQKTAHTFH